MLQKAFVATRIELQKINSLDEFNRTPLHHACWSRSITCIKLLLKMGADVDTLKCPTAHLHAAYLCNKVECAEMLLKHGANVCAFNCSDKTPLCL
ncbi:hypothetical protein CDAR_568901 [Caerostris darwini]|uniref:Uncharacterized protein n=1 Tax=Caerostris darwini TaxID=1538125 RepID=A0AAV4MIL1_9ARAC|nr:hypothetical protein CDAR_568901 [Caerostris darwini]